jgi:hypothetical protein
MPRKVFAPGDVLTASDVMTFLMNQAVVTFADAAARTAALPTPSEGMVAYLNDTNSVEYYDGSAWETLNPPAPTNQLITTDATVAAANAGGIIYATNSTAVTVTVDDVFTSLGDRVDIIRDGAGAVNIVAGSGVTDFAGIGTAGTALTFIIDEQHNAATIIRVAANAYRVIGKISL